MSCFSCEYDYTESFYDYDFSDFSDFSDTSDTSSEYADMIGCEFDGERVVGWYGELTTIPIVDEHAALIDRLKQQDEHDQSYYYRQLGYRLDNPKFGNVKFSNVKSVDDDLRKYAKQGINGVKGRRTREYSAKKIAKERRACGRVSYASLSVLSGNPEI
jgi:hypothetical protein